MSDKIKNALGYLGMEYFPASFELEEYFPNDPSRVIPWIHCEINEGPLEVCPMPPPRGEIYYMNTTYNER